MAASQKCLSFMLTLKCPIRCSHCVTGSGPERDETLDNDFLEQAIREAADCGIKYISFTGGDPFAFPEKLRFCSDLAVSLDMSITVATSAFWAKTQERALEMLSGLQLAMLGISTDEYHQEFVSIQKIRNAIRAAKAVGVPIIEVQAVYLEKSTVAQLREELASDLEGVTFHAQKLWPIGRGSELIKNKDHLLVAVDDLDLRCPCMSTPVVRTSGKMFGCCSSLLDLEDAHPFYLGDLRKQSVKDVLQDARSNRYYQYIKNFGLRAIVDMIRSQGLASEIKASYTDVCHLCYDLHTNGKTKRFLEAKLTESLHQPVKLDGAPPP